MWLQGDRHPKIADGEDRESLLPVEIDRKTQFRSSQYGFVLRDIILLVISHGLVALVGAFLGARSQFDSTLIASQITSRYSPFISHVGLKYHTVQYNGSFFHETSFRKDAGPEVDAAWASLGVDYRALRVSEDEAARSGLAHDQVKINLKYGGGFPANVEGLHHLHCLNLLRQSLYYNFDYYHALGQGAFKNDDLILKTHVTHCLDILRQQLMCTVDVGMLGQIWWNKTYPTSFVDFNTKHTCRNFEDVRKYAEERQLPAKVPKDFLKPPEKGDKIYDLIP